MSAQSRPLHRHRDSSSEAKKPMAIPIPNNVLLEQPGNLSLKPMSIEDELPVLPDLSNFCRLTCITCGSPNSLAPHSADPSLYHGFDNAWVKQYSAI